MGAYRLPRSTTLPVRKLLIVVEKNSAQRAHWIVADFRQKTGHFGRLKKH